jgi:hypothetical protein
MGKLEQRSHAMENYLQVIICRKTEALTSSIEGSGMNKPTVWFLGYSNGGTYALEICNTNNNTCCRHSQHTPCYSTIIFAKKTSNSLFEYCFKLIQIHSLITSKGKLALLLEQHFGSGSSCFATNVNINVSFKSA